MGRIDTDAVKSAGAEWCPYGGQVSIPVSRPASLIGQQNAGFTIIDQRGRYMASNDHDVVVLGWQPDNYQQVETRHVGSGRPSARYVVWRVYFNGDGPLYSAGDYLKDIDVAVEHFMKR